MLKNRDNQAKAVVFENTAFLHHVPSVASSKLATLLKRKPDWKEGAFSPYGPALLQLKGQGSARACVYGPMHRRYGNAPRTMAPVQEDDFTGGAGQDTSDGP